MTLDIPLSKINTGEQALSFLGSKNWTKLRHNTKNLNTMAPFTHALTREVLNCVRKHVGLNLKKHFKQFYLFISFFSFLKATYFLL